MARITSIINRPLAVFAAVSIFACLPIWSVRYFINQDGSGHAHSAWLMIGLLRGDPLFTSLYEFNFIFFPNVSGHWLLALLLLVADPVIATKIMMTVTFVGLIATVGWLRWCTSGRDGLTTSLLLGATFGFTSLWLEGFYNFELGLIVAFAGVGFYYLWRDRMGLLRSVLIAAMLFGAFISHLISFGVLAGAIIVICVLPLRELDRRRAIWTAAAFIPMVPVVLLYRSSTEAELGFMPEWRSLHDVTSLTDWLTQLRGIDSFIIISRKTFPFVGTESTMFAVFTPLVWIVAGLILLMAATRLARHRAEGPYQLNCVLPFLVLAVGGIVVSLFAPDDLRLSTSSGGILRERVFLAGLMFTIPLYRTAAASKVLLTAANLILILVIVFQTAALWEYALTSDKMAREFMPAGAAIPDRTRVASVTIEPNSGRYSASPISSMDNYFGIGRDVVIWDNYELGHKLFPVKMKDLKDQMFVLEYTGSNTSRRSGTSSADDRAARLSETLSKNHEKIDVLVVWGVDTKMETAFVPWFDGEPYYTNGRVRLFKHR
jgi:hypothetical protein